MYIVYIEGVAGIESRSGPKTRSDDAYRLRAGAIRRELGLSSSVSILSFVISDYSYVWRFCIFLVSGPKECISERFQVGLVD
jgi:hypothetical protein